MSIEARNRLLPVWFTRIKTRQTVLPRFQRFEAWDAANVSQLFNTILRDLPIGSVLTLDVGNEEPFISRPLAGAPETGERVTEHLLDGQQRLTALWRGLHNNYEHRTFFLYFEPDEETGMAYYVDSIARWKKDGDKEMRPFWANAPRELWKRRMVPLHLIAPDIIAEKAYRAWAREAIESDDEREDLASQVSAIRQHLGSFNLPFLSLPVTTPKATALDVFIRMNTSAAPLSMYDIVVAQVEAGLGESLHDLVADIKGAAPGIESYYSPEDLALYVSALFQSRAPRNSTYIGRDFGPQLMKNWDRLLDGASRTVEFLEQERVFDLARLPTDVVVPVLVALWGSAPAGLDAEGRARTILRRYLWRSFFSNRYEKATSSRSLIDYNELAALLADKSAATPEIFDDSRHPLPTVQEFLTAGWPVRKDRIARAVLALALRKGGLDLADGGVATRQNLKKREYHHLFPVAHLRREGIGESKAFVALNCALVTWRTNRNISDKNPERYLAERREGTDLGEVEVRARLASHHIPFDEMVAGDYQAFLQKRAALMHQAMLDLCVSGGS